MSTIFHQPPRSNFSISLMEHIDYIQESALACGITLDQAIAIYHAAALERANDLAHANGDIWDEQIAGLACLLKDIAEK